MVLPDPRDFHTPLSSHSKEELLKSSEGGYFGPGNAQLPAPRWTASPSSVWTAANSARAMIGLPVLAPRFIQQWERVAVVIEARRSLFLWPSPRRPLGIDGSRENWDVNRT